MEITLTKEESEEMFYNALCNAVGSGYIDSYGIEMVHTPEDYDRARSKLENPCYEDVLMQILKDGGKLTLEDVEGEGDHTSTIGIEEVYERLSNVPIKHLTDMINEQDDAVTADVVLQTVFYNEIIFG